MIDFIDMDEKRNNRAVERRLKDALKNDRARIQVGRISHFGLMEMSRQRIRTSVLESSTDKCPTCGGTGHVRSVSSLALQLLRVIDETLLRAGTHNLVVRTGPDVALYILNHKRGHLRDLEQRFQITITVTADGTIGPQQPFIVDKGDLVHSPEQARIIAAQGAADVAAVEEDVEDELAASDDEIGDFNDGEVSDIGIEAPTGDGVVDGVQQDAQMAAENAGGGGGAAVEMEMTRARQHRPEMNRLLKRLKLILPHTSRKMCKERRNPPLRLTRLTRSVMSAPMAAAPMTPTGAVAGADDAGVDAIAAIGTSNRLAPMILARSMTSRNFARMRARRLAPMRALVRRPPSRQLKRWTKPRLRIASPSQV